MPNAKAPLKNEGQRNQQIFTTAIIWCIVTLKLEVILNPLTLSIIAVVFLWYSVLNELLKKCINESCCTVNVFFTKYFASAFMQQSVTCTVHDLAEYETLAGCMYNTLDIVVGDQMHLKNW